MRHILLCMLLAGCNTVPANHWKVQGTRPHPFTDLVEIERLNQIAIEENGAAPGPRHLAEVIDRARKQGTKTVFIQPQVSASYAETVAKAIGAKMVTMDPLAEDYIENLRAMARKIASGLGEPGTR